MQRSTTAVVIFTRDLRVHDHSALVAASRRAASVLGVFVLDPDIIGGRYAAPNRLKMLVDALAALRAGLRARGGELAVRWGAPDVAVATLARQLGADEVHGTADVSAYAVERLRRLRHALAQLPGGGPRLVVHGGTTVVPAGELTPAGRDHYAVFTPYWRRWREMVLDPPLAAPSRLRAPADVDPGALPVLAELTRGRSAPGIATGGEPAARRRLDAWETGPVEDYGRAAGLEVDATSRLSADLHLGCVSPREVVVRLAGDQPGREDFRRQLAWRDFNHQLLAARPDLVRAPLRPPDGPWLQDPQGFEAWRAGRTGYPLLDAGLRQLRTEGWMPNRLRMLTASFLAKHLLVDWRLGAWHFMDHLADGDLANNFVQWQWAAGTGVDTRPNRLFNPVVQSRRHDPHGAYLRRHLPELAGLDDRQIHEPWTADPARRTVLDYPPPLVDHAVARERFLTGRRR